MSRRPSPTFQVLRQNRPWISRFLAVFMALWQIGQPLQANTLTEQFGGSSTNSSLITGATGLQMNGGGSIRLDNLLNDYTGVTTLNHGSLIITNGALLGTDTTAILIRTNNSTPLNTNLIGFGGGSLVLDGTTTGFTLGRDINFEGRGPIGDRGAAIQSLGNNTLSGVLTSAVSPLPLSPTATIRNSRINSVNGTLTLSGTLNAGGTSATTFTSLGGVNSAGVGNFTLTGVLAGTGSIEKSGAGTLFLNPSSTSGFSGTVRVSGSSIGQQSSVRVTQATVGGTSIFGANTISGDDPSAIDMNGGVLEFRNEGNMDFNALSSGKNVYLRANSTFYTGPAAGGEAIIGLTTLGTFRVAANTTGTFNSRNGYGMALQAWTQESSNNNTGIANNMGGTLTFTGDAWNNADADPRNLTFSGNGNTRIAGSIVATVGTGNGKQVIKQGTGELILNGVGGTFTGATIVEGGSLRITDFRSINNNTIAVRLGNAGTTPGNLIIGGTGTGTATGAGLTTSKPILFNSTTGQSAIYANQALASPVILNGAITTVLTTGNYNLGGSSTQDNIINVALPAGTTGGLTKVGAGTWVLNAANLYTGATTIQGGTLKLRATGAASNVILETATNLITFNSQGTAQTAGGVLEFRGVSTGATTETLGALTPTAGAATVRLLGQGGFAANLVFNNATAALGATTAATSVNFDTSGANGGTISFTGVAPTAATATTLPGTANFQGHLYINGANFADVAAGVVTAPAYGGAGNFRDAGAALVAATHNRLTAATASGAATISSLLTNSQTLTLSGNLVVSTGGILQSGGTASILSDSGTARLIQGNVAGTNVAIRVNLGTDVLNLGNATNPVNISSTTTAGLTKNGAGTLVVFGTNAQTGTTTINEGKVSLNGAAARLSAATASLVVRQGATLELLTGVTAANAVVNAVDGAGTISGQSGQTFTQNGGGTWNGVFSGTGLNITKGGAAATWSGVSTYTGVTTIGGTGLVTVDTLANGGVSSGIGASTSDAANLVFTGSTAGIDYRGNIIDTALTLGSRSASTDRLFTLAATATGANLTSTASNNNAIVWSNTGAIVNNTTANATLTFAGTGTGLGLGDNTFNPQLVDSSVGGGVTLGVTKSGAGQWNLGNASNIYTGLTTIADGILGLNNNGSLPANSPLVLGSTTTSGILQASGSFSRTLSATATAGTGTITWGGTTGGGGFAAHSTALTVTLDSGAGLTWGSGGFVGTGGVQSLILNSSSSLADVTFTNAIDLGAAARTITVNDNANTGADYANLTGVLSGAGGGLFKNGSGILRVGNANTYTGITSVDAGTLVVSSLGNSSTPGATGVGDSTGGNVDAGAIVLGNASTTGGNLVYAGPGETSDRKIRLRGTTANNAIYADGSGPLILTNVAHDTTETGAKTLSLRGSNTAGNTISSVLANNGAGVLSVTVDGGASWILNNAGNTYTGNTTAGAGALGIGDDLALGAGTLVFNNGNIFAHGADRNIANAITHNNNTTAAFLGDNSLTFNATLNLAAAANNNTTTNNLVTGKALTFNNGVTANALTANRAWIIDGAGETIINGTFTTSTAFGVRFDVNGGGTLNLGTNGATSNFNQSITAVDVDRGALKFSANNAIPTLAALSGGVTLTPELATADTAKIDLNGTSQTFNAFTATTDGISIIDNSSVSAATLIVGANNTVTTFGTGGTGTYSITQSGGGAINLGKIGTGTANFTGTLGNTGTVTSNGGVLNLNSATGATGAVGDGGAVNFKGGITTPGNLTSVTTNNGGLVSFASGSGTPFNNLGTLNLSLTANSGLELDVGDSGTDKLASTLASVSNVTTLFIKDTDITGGTTYDLLVNAGGGLGVLGNYLLNLPGYSGSTLTVTPTLVQLNAGTLITSDVYWNNGTGLGGGTLTQAWNTVDGVTNNINFSGVVAGAPALQLNENLPGKGQKVIFQGDNITGGAPLATTLEQAFTVNTLEFRQSTTAADTSRTISIAPGAVGSNSLTAKPTLATDGINLQTGAVGTVSISAPFVAGADQTWTVADAPVELVGGVITGTTNVAVTSTSGLRPGMTVTGSGIVAGTTIDAIVDGTNFTLSTAATNATVNILAAQQLNMSGALSGAGDVVKAGAGKVVLGGSNGTLAGTYTNNAGITQVDLLSALGGQVGVPGSGSDITVIGGSFYYNNGTAGTFVNDIALNGGTLSAGGAAHTYSGAIAVTADSTINMRDQAGSVGFTTTSRAITLSGLVSGIAGINVDSVTTPTGGNQLTGNLVFNNAASTWNGPLNLTRGSVFFQNVAASGNATPYVVYDGIINFNQFGRVVYRNIDGTSLNRTAAINVAASAIGELSIDNVGALATNYVVNQQGAVNLNGGSILRLSTDDGSELNLAGGVVLNGNASITVQGSAQADNVVTISGTGISGTGNLAINDEAGAWAVTSRTIHLSVANTYIGNTTLNEGILLLGHKDALSNGSLTITGTSTLQASTDLSAGGSGPVANALILGTGNLTVSGANNLTTSGLVTGTGADADRTLTSSITGPATLVIAGGLNLGAGANTVARTLTLAGTGLTTISSAIVDGNAFANNLTVTNTGTTTLTNTNTYTGLTTMNGAAGILLLQGSNASAGATTLTAGTIQLDNASNGGLASGLLTLNGGTLQAQTALRTITNNVTIAASSTVSGSQSITWSGGLVEATGGNANRTLTNNLDAGQLLTISGTVNVGATGTTAARTFGVAGTGDTSITGAMVNNTAFAHVLAKTGSGTLTLSNTGNAYTGGTTINFGTLRTGASNVIPNTGTVTVNATTAGTALFDLNGNSETIAALALGGTGGLATSVNQVTTGAGTLTLGGTVTVSSTGNFTTPALISGNLGLGAARTFTIGDSTGTTVDLDVQAVVSGAFAITKNGQGTLQLSGTNTFTGSTTVTDGQLLLDYTTNNTGKIAAGAGLVLGGATNELNPTVVFNGNASAPTTQAFTTLTVNAGSNNFSVTSNGGQAANVNFTTITRATGGTVDFSLPALGSITTTQPLVNGILGGYATLNNGTAFASKDGSNNLVAATSAAKDDVTTWLATDNVVDSAGFTNSLLDCTTVNSITFSAAAPSVVTSLGRFGINSGGILVTSTATAPSITGGTLVSGTGDIIVNAYSATDLTIASAIRGATSVTKAGTGALVLAGSNTSTGQITITEGLVKVSGGNGIGDAAAVSLKNVAGSGLQFLSSETVGNITGGGALGGSISIGSNTLTTNTSANIAYSGALSGTGTIVKQGTANFNLDTTSHTGFSGNVLINQGLFFLSGNGVANLPNVASITTNQGGAFLLDFNSGTTGSSRINDLASINLSSYGNGGFAGLQIRSNQDTSHTESYGALNLQGGSSLVGVAQAGGTNRTLTLTASSLNRLDNATVFLGGRNLAVTTGDNRGRIFFNAAPSLVGGTGVAGAVVPATNVPILRFAVTQANTAAFTVTDIPNTFANYNPTTGVTPLLIATEYQLDSTGYTASVDANDNLRFTTGTTGLVTKAFNVAVFDSSSAAMTVSGVGGGGNVLTIGSGAMLFTSTVSANGTTLDGFDSITPGSASSNEWIITAANTTATINSVLTDGAAATTLTKSGTGTLVLGGSNTYTGPTVFNQGAIRASSLSNLGAGTALNFFGGTLQFGGVFDPSTRVTTINAKGGGATLDTNGNDIVIANAIGNSGNGALTKTGAGNLTINTPATHTGGTIVTNGTLTAGTANILPVTSGLTVNGATAFLDVGTFNQTVGTFTLAAGTMNGTATITASDIQLQGGTQSAGVVLAGTTAVKTTAGVVTLAGANTFTGPLFLTNGEISFNSIAGADGTASALGAPTTDTAGAIQMGLGANATALTYTGFGHTTNRAIELVGSTGSSTINANGTGALVLNGAISSEEYGAKTLVLGGTSDTLIANRITAPISECFGVLTLQKTGTATWELTAVNTFTGATNVDEGILRSQIVNALPTTTALRVGSGTTVGTLDLNGFNQTVASLSSASNSTSQNTVLISTGTSLTTSSVALANNTDGASTNLTLSGGGALVVNGTSITVGSNTGGTNFSSKASLNLAALGSFSATLSGNLTVQQTGDNSVADNASLVLSDTANTITTPAVIVGGSSTGSVNTLTLGAGTNFINANLVHLGSGTRDSGVVGFAGANGSVTLRNTVGTGRANVTLGVGTTQGTGYTTANNFDVTGHTADLAIGTLATSLGAKTASNTNDFKFNQGTLDILTINMAAAKGAGTSVNKISIGGGTTFIGGSAAFSDTGTGTATLATAGSGELEITGGSVTSSVALVRAVGTGSATVTLNGGTLNMSSQSIGTTALPITFTAASGTLNGLSELNGGGALTKTTSGTLIMGAANAYTGATTVSDGTLQVGVAGVGTTGTGLITAVKVGATYANAAMISGSGSLGGAVVIGDTVTAANRGILAPGDGNTNSSNATLTITAVGGLTIAAGSQTQLGITAASGIDSTFAASGMTASAYLASLGSTSDASLTTPAAWANQPTAGQGDFIKLNSGTGALVLGTNGIGATAGQGIVSIFSNGLNTGTLAAGQIFNLVDWFGAFSGDFSTGISGVSTGGMHGDFDLPDISTTTFGWDISAFTSHGVIAVVVVPEPSRALLMLIGLLALGFRRRRIQG